MGIIRKTFSMSTLGLVKFTSRREAQTKLAHAQARQVRAQTRAIRKSPAMPPVYIDYSNGDDAA